MTKLYEVKMELTEEVKSTKTEYIKADSKQEAMEKVEGFVTDQYVADDKFNYTDANAISAEPISETEFTNDRIGLPSDNT